MQLQRVAGIRCVVPSRFNVPSYPPLSTALATHPLSPLPVPAVTLDSARVWPVLSAVHTHTRTFVLDEGRRGALFNHRGTLEVFVQRSAGMCPPLDTLQLFHPPNSSSPTSRSPYHRSPRSRTRNAFVARSSEHVATRAAKRWKEMQGPRWKEGPRGPSGQYDIVRFYLDSLISIRLSLVARAFYIPPSRARARARVQDVSTVRARIRESP